MDIVNIHNCYGCGKDNPVGLRLNISHIGDKSHIEFEVKPQYCGYPGVLHGGLAAVLFDEAMFHAIAKSGIEAVTASMSIEYISPAFEGHILVCEGEIENRDGRKIDVVATLTDKASGRIIAKARGRFLEVDLKKVLDS
ncbi:MAG TPA: PaaI family thioesterase [Clostridiales bacterium]|nr:PaaI family thioesterase [Clostridiales bacterium]